MTPRNVTSFSFLSFSRPSPYILLTATIAAAIRSLSPGSEYTVLPFFTTLAEPDPPLDLGDAFRTRFPVLVATLGGGGIGNDAEATFLSSFLATGMTLGLDLCLLCCTKGALFCNDLTGEGLLDETDFFD